MCGRKRLRFRQKKYENYASMSPSESSKRNIKTADLIKAIKEQPCLWDRKSNEYKDRNRRGNAWQEVYKILDANYDELQQSEQIEFGVQVTKKWYNIRDAYAKTRRHQTSKRPYLYSDLLSFMDSQYLDRSGYNELSSANESKADEDSVEDTEESMQHCPEEVYLNENEDIYGTPAKRFRMNDGSLIIKPKEQKTEENLMKVLESLLGKESDEDRSFFQAVLSSVKSLSEDSKYEFRIGVLKLIQTLKKKNKEQTTVKTEPFSEVSE